MMDARDGKRTYMYQGQLPGWLVFLLMGPLLLVFFSVALALIGGGLLAAVIFPLLFRGGRRSSVPRGDRQTIELDPSQYRHVEPPQQQLPDD